MASRPEAVNARCAVLSGTTQRPRGGDSMAQEVALVTGASSGIGEALARRIARDGRHVQGELDEIRLNVEVLVELTGRCLPAMVARKAGVVMNIASVGAFAPGPYMATYAATKAFVLSFSEGIAAELGGTGVQVLCVCPGFTRTEFQEKAAVDVSGVPGFAWMSAEQVADQAVRAVGRGPVLVNGTMNSLMTGALRFVPRGMVSRAVSLFLKPK